MANSYTFQPRSQAVTFNLAFNLPVALCHSGHLSSHTTSFFFTTCSAPPLFSTSSRHILTSQPNVIIPKKRNHHQRHHQHQHRDHQHVKVHHLKRRCITIFASRGFGFLKPPEFAYTGPLRPGSLSPPRIVPPSIKRPPYAQSGKPKYKKRLPWDIEVKTAEEIQKMRVAGRLAREVLDIAGAAVRPGITTDEIDAIVHVACIERNCYPSPLNYSKFPKSCCTSINEVICHGIPDSTKLKDGDIINLDITVYHDGVHGDCSEMFLVGEVDEAGKKLVKVTYEAMEKAIEICKPGVAYSEIGCVIEPYVNQHGFESVREFCGHGIGADFHTTPNVVHYKNKEKNGIMAAGHCFTIEPMICEGTINSVLWPDNWTATTQDGKRSAQFEHTLLITETGVERLTGRTETSNKFWWEV